MDINKVTKYITTNAIAIAYPNDLFGKMTNLFFVTVPIVFVAAKHLYNWKYPTTVTQLTLDEKIRIRSLIDSVESNKFDEAKEALIGKEDLDLWKRLILKKGVDNTQEAKDLITQAPKNLQVSLYRELASLAFVKKEDPKQILQEIIQLEISKFDDKSAFSSSKAVDQLLTLAKEYCLPLEQLTDKLSKLKDEEIFSKLLPKVHYQLICQVKMELKNLSGKHQAMINKISNLLEILPGNTKLTRCYKKEQLVANELKKLCLALEKDNLLEISTAEEWQKFYLAIPEMIGAHQVDVSALINKAMELTDALPFNTSEQIKHKGSLYFKVLKYGSDIKCNADKKSFFSLLKCISSDDLKMPAIDKIGLGANSFPYLFLKEDENKLLEHCTNWMHQCKEKLKNEQNLENFKNILDLIETTYNRKICKIEFITGAESILKNYSPKDISGLKNQMKHICRLIQLNYTTNAPLYNEIGEIIKGELFQSLDLRDQIDLHLRLARSLSITEFTKQADKFREEAMNLAAQLPDETPIQPWRTSIKFGKYREKIESKFEIFRKIYLECVEKDDLEQAGRCIGAMEATTKAVPSVVEKMTYLRELAKLHLGNAPIDSNPKGNPEKFYPKTSACDRDNAWKVLTEAVNLTFDEEFKDYPPREKVMLLEKLAEVSQLFGNSSLTGSLLESAFRIAKTIPDPFKEFEEKAKVTEKNKYEILVELASKFHKAEMSIDQILEELRTIAYKLPENQELQIDHLLDAAQKIYAFTKETDPTSQCLNQIFLKAYALIKINLEPKSLTPTILEIKKYVSALEKIHKTQTDVQFIDNNHTNEYSFHNHRERLRVEIERLIDPIPLSIGNYFTSKSQVKEITELKASVIRILDNNGNFDLGTAITKANEYTKKEDRFEALSILFPLAISLGCYEEMQPYLIKILSEEKNQKEVFNLALLVATELAKKAESVGPGAKYENSVAFGKLGDYLTNLYKQCDPVIKNLRPSEQVVAYRTFAKNFGIFPKLKVEFSGDCLEAYKSTILKMSSGKTKKVLLENLTMLIFKLGLPIETDAICDAIKDCDWQIKKKNALTNAVAYTCLWSLARIFTDRSTSIGEKFYYLSFCSTLYKTSNHFIGAAYN